MIHLLNIKRCLTNCIINLLTLRAVILIIAHVSLALNYDKSITVIFLTIGQNSRLCTKLGVFSLSPRTITDCKTLHYVKI